LSEDVRGRVLKSGPVVDPAQGPDFDQVARVNFNFLKKSKYRCFSKNNNKSQRVTTEFLTESYKVIELTR
jgi:hypothetical protein